MFYPPSWTVIYRLTKSWSIDTIRLSPHMWETASDLDMWGTDNLMLSNPLRAIKVDGSVRR